MVKNELVNSRTAFESNQNVLVCTTSFKFERTAKMSSLKLTNISPCFVECVLRMRAANVFKENHASKPRLIQSSILTDKKQTTILRSPHRTPPREGTRGFANR